MCLAVAFIWCSFPVCYVGFSYTDCHGQDINANLFLAIGMRLRLFFSALAQFIPVYATGDGMRHEASGSKQTKITTQSGSQEDGVDVPVLLMRPGRPARETTARMPYGMAQRMMEGEVSD